MTSILLSVVPAATGGCCINKQHFAVDRENVTLHSLYFLFSLQNFQFSYPPPCGCPEEEMPAISSFGHCRQAGKDDKARFVRALSAYPASHHNPPGTN